MTATTTSTATTATTQTTATTKADVPATPSPETRPTTVQATISNPNNYNETAVMNFLVEKLEDAKEHFQIVRLNTTTMEIEFTGPNAADNAEEFSKLSLTDLSQVDLSSPSLINKNTTPAPEDESGSSKMALFAGIAIGALIVVGGIGYLVYRKKASSGGTGSSGHQKLNFNLDYDEEAFLGNYENEMGSMNTGNRMLL